MPIFGRNDVGRFIRRARIIKLLAAIDFCELSFGHLKAEFVKPRKRVSKFDTSTVAPHIAGRRAYIASWARSPTGPEPSVVESPLLTTAVHVRRIFPPKQMNSSYTNWKGYSESNASIFQYRLVLSNASLLSVHPSILRRRNVCG